MWFKNEKDACLFLPWVFTSLGSCIPVRSLISMKHETACVGCCGSQHGPVQTALYYLWSIFILNGY